MPLEITNWKSIYEDMEENGYPAPGSIWAKRNEILASIWPGWKNAFEKDGVQPSEYESTIYVPPTLKQFLGMWETNVSRARKFADEARA